MLGEQERALLRDVLQRLASQVDLSVRTAVARRVADDPHTPLDLVLVLADDHIELARPLILRSRCLTDTVLLKRASGWDVPRRTFCAQRPHIGAAVTELLAEDDCESVLIALACNATATLQRTTYAKLVERSKLFPALQERLVRRPDLPPELAAEMHGWVSPELQLQLEYRHGFRFDVLTSRNTPRAQLVQDSESSCRLVEKLATANQLKPGVLLRALHQGQLEVFEFAFAKLLQIKYSQIRRVLYDGRAHNLAMACRAVGIDRSAFPTIYNLSCEARRMPSTLTPDDRAVSDAIFNSYSKAAALAYLQAY